MNMNYEKDRSLALVWFCEVCNYEIKFDHFYKSKESLIKHIKKNHTYDDLVECIYRGRDYPTMLNEPTERQLEREY